MEEQGLDVGSNVLDPDPADGASSGSNNNSSDSNLDDRRVDKGDGRSLNLCLDNLKELNYVAQTQHQKDKFLMSACYSAVQLNSDSNVDLKVQLQNYTTELNYVHDARDQFQRTEDSYNKIIKDVTNRETDHDQLDQDRKDIAAFIDGFSSRSAKIHDLRLKKQQLQKQMDKLLPKLEPVLQLRQTIEQFLEGLPPPCTAAADSGHSAAMTSSKDGRQKKAKKIDL